MADERVRLSNIKTALDEINGSDFSVECFPPASPEILSQYPIDFRLFLEEIGNVNIVSGIKHGHQVLRMDEPRPLIGLNDDRETGLYSLDDFHFDDVCFGRHLAQNIRIFAVDVDANLYGYSISEDDFALVGTEVSDGEFSTFTDWFVSFINNQVNSMPWLPQVRLL